MKKGVVLTDFEKKIVADRKEYRNKILTDRLPTPKVGWQPSLTTYPEVSEEQAKPTELKAPAKKFSM